MHATLEIEVEKLPIIFAKLVFSLSPYYLYQDPYTALMRDWEADPGLLMYKDSHKNRGHGEDNASALSPHSPYISV